MMKCAEDEILSTTEAITTTPTEEERQKEHEKEEAPRWRPRRKCGRPGNVTEALLDRGPKTPENPRKHAASLYRRPKSDRHIKRPLLHRRNGDGRKISQRGQREEKRKHITLPGSRMKSVAPGTGRSKQSLINCPFISTSSAKSQPTTTSASSGGWAAAECATAGASARRVPREQGEGP